MHCPHCSKEWEAEYESTWEGDNSHSYLMNRLEGWIDTECPKCGREGVEGNLDDYRRSLEAARTQQAVTDMVSGGMEALRTTNPTWASQIEQAHVSTLAAVQSGGDVSDEELYALVGEIALAMNKSEGGAGQQYQPPVQQAAPIQ